MTITSLPFDSTPAYEADWQVMMRALMPACVIRLQRTVTDLNLFEVYGDSSGMQVKVKSGTAYIEGFIVKSTAEEVKAITTSNPTNPRIDRVILKLNRTSNTITLEVKAGTAAASPVPPTLTETDDVWEMSLAQVYVAAAASTITAGNVTDERTFSGYHAVKSMDSDAYKAVGIMHTDSDSFVVVGDGNQGIPIPLYLNGYQIVDVQVNVTGAKGVTGTMDVQLRRKRAGAVQDIMTTKITVGDEWYARDGVIDSTYNIVQTGDSFFFDVDTIHSGTAAKGLSGLLVLKKV